MLHPARGHRPLSLLAGLLALAALATGCNSVGSRPSATSEARASVSSPIAVPSTVPSIGTTTEASFADWIEVQGFGGSSGLREINKLVKLENESPSAATEYEIRDQLATIGALRAWLDAHRPTACWADYHDAVSSGLATLASGYAAIGEAVSGGKPFPADVSAAMVTVSAKLLAMEQPAGCD